MPLSTAAAITIGLGSAAATAASNIHSTKSASRTNERSIEAQREADARAAELERVRMENERKQQEEETKIAREQLAERERARQESLAFDRQRWDSYLSASQPYWAVGQKAFGSLLDLAGGGTRAVAPNASASAPVAAAPTAGASAATPQAGAAGSGTGRSLLDLAGVTASRSTPRYQPRRIAAPVTGPPQASGMTLLDLARLAAQAGEGQTGEWSSRWFTPRAGQTA